MTDRITTVAAALVAAGAVLAVPLPAEAVTAPPASASPSPAASAGTPSAQPSRSAAPPAPIRVAPPPAPTRSATPTPTPILTPTPTPPPTPVAPPPVATAISVTQGRTGAASAATMTGSQLTNLRAVRVGGQLVTDLVLVSPTLVRFTVPAAADYQAKVAPITLTAAADGITRPTALTYTYVVQTRVDRQMAYAFQNWNSYANATFGYLANNDCTNFASQTLLVRGWQRSADWYNRGPGRWSSTWVSSTALSTWLKTRPDLATWLPYRQRDQVQVGDIVQFRWPGYKKGYRAWDHTGIVSKVVVLPNGRHDVYYTSHTLNRQYGGSTQTFARVMAKDLRIQFFRLR